MTASPILTIANDGARIKSTNYWATEAASAGLCYLSGNAGVWRLLVPEAAQGLLLEMRTGKSVTIEPSLHDSRCWDVVFVDGTESPFSIAIDKRQLDRALAIGKWRLAVWTEAGGKVLDLPCKVRL